MVSAIEETSDPIFMETNHDKFVEELIYDFCDPTSLASRNYVLKYLTAASRRKNLPSSG